MMMYDKISISDFNEEEAFIYIKTLISIAFIDNVFGDTEKNFLLLQAERLNLEIKSLLKKPEKNFSFLKNLNLSKKFKIALLRDCIILSNIDGEYNSLEKASIITLTSILNLEKSQIEKIEAWREEYLF